MEGGDPVGERVKVIKKLFIGTLGKNKYLTLAVWGPSNCKCIILISPEFRGKSVPCHDSYKILSTNSGHRHTHTHILCCNSMNNYKHSRPSPLRVRRVSALSGRRDMRNSALLVNMRYGSRVPCVVKSSMRTPMYPSVRLTVNAG